jgi:hypothetical protein
MSKTLGQRLADFNIEVGTAMTIDWEQVRIQAAIAAMQGMLANETHSASVGIIAKEDGKSNTEVMAEAAVQLADALIAELQKKQD